MGEVIAYPEGSLFTKTAADEVITMKSQKLELIRRRDTPWAQLQLSDFKLWLLKKVDNSITRLVSLKHKIQDKQDNYWLVNKVDETIVKINKDIMTQKAWTDWKTTIMGVIMILISVIAIFNKEFTFDKQLSVYNIMGNLLDLLPQLSLLITGLINIFKTIWKK